MNYLPYVKPIDKQREHYLYLIRILEACHGDKDKMRYLSGEIDLHTLMYLEAQKLKHE